MSGGFSNKPKILRGAFIEYGLSIPPLFVVFQFNPVQLARNRSLSFDPPNDTVPCTIQRPQSSETPSRPGAGTGARSGTGTTPPTPVTGTRPLWASLREYHKKNDLMDIQKNQKVTIGEESISFEIRLDATDKLDEGDGITQQFGIAPQLAALELMVHPKEESLLGQALGALLGSPKGFSFTRGNNPPMVLFIWGLKRVLPVNINSMNITETEFSTKLDPVRATVAVSLTVVECKDALYMYSKVMKEAMAVLNLANIADIADVVIPG